MPNLALALECSSEWSEIAVCLKLELVFFCPALPTSQAENLQLSSPNQRPSARLEPPPIICFYSPDTRQQLKVKVGWEGVSLWIFFFFSGPSRHKGISEPWEWRELGSNPGLITSPLTLDKNILAFLSLNCFSCSKGVMILALKVVIGGVQVNG